MLTPTVLLSLCSAALGAETPGADLVAAFAERAPAADYLFVLDTSGTLLPAAEAVRSQIASFVEVVPAGDSVGVIALHTRATEALPFTRVTQAGRADLAGRVRELELTSAKSQDLGAGLALLSDRLNRSDASPSQIVFFQGNFCHDPSVSSEWDTGGRGCRAVRGLDALATGFRAGRADRVLAVSLFPLEVAGRPVFEPGIEAVRALLEPVGEVRQSTLPLGDHLAALVPSLALERVRGLARAEADAISLTLTVDRPPTQDDPVAILHVGAGLTHLGLRLDNLHVAGPITHQPAAPMLLAPDGRLELVLDVPQPPFSLLPRSDVVELPISLRASGTLVPANDLSAIGVETAQPALTAAVVLRVGRRYGPTPTVAAMMILAIFLTSASSAVVIRGRTLPRRLGGAFSWRRTSGERRILEVAELAEAAIVVLPDGELALGPAQNAVLRVRIVRPIWKEHAVVDIFSSDVEINGNKVKPGRHRVVAGATSFRFGEYRLTWE